MLVSETTRYLSEKVSLFKNKGYTLSKMAEELNMSYGQLRNIRDRKVEKPNFTNAVKAFNYFNVDQTDRAELLKKDYPEMYNYEELQQQRAPTAKINHKVAKKVQASVLSYRIFSIADCSCGIKRQQITDMWGKDGIQVLDELLEDEILFEDGSGLIKSNSETSRSSDRELNLNKQRLCLNFIDLNDVGNAGTWLSTQTQSVTKERYIQLKKEVMEFYFVMSKKLRNERYFGSIPVFFNMNLGKFLNEEKSDD